ncbi:helix-turn-helix domain-containing protein [Bifidobacterium aemilianum]|uniref:helix-turn-helix domain-containing protein n=1 Tax=Bifidobacterium aemilianum TaxID=2493120 RepID=UPI001374F48C|nr:helix-turn-helix transcriptional regulator [Bifidobacterium aemilianum]
MAEVWNSAIRFAGIDRSRVCPRTDHAGRICASRQTISNWENDRNYPDVQNLLILSNPFDVTIDQLIKGDLDIMDKSIDSEAKTLRRPNWAGVIPIALMYAAIIIGFSLYMMFHKQIVILDATLAVVVIAAVLGVLTFAYTDRIKARNDVQTYREIKAFLAGEEVDRSKRTRFQRWAIPQSPGLAFKSHPIAGPVIAFFLVCMLGCLLGVGIVWTLIHVFGISWLAQGKRHAL